jgi:antirestriction protein ArdC
MTTPAQEATTAAILDAMDAGMIPWRKPWNEKADGPRNAEGRLYHGVNVWTLTAARMARGYSDPRYVTFAGALALGGHVNKGARSWPIVFGGRVPVKPDPTDDPEEVQLRRILKVYRVFNVAECTLDLPALPELPPDPDPIEAAESIIAGMPRAPRIEYGGGRAAYSPSRDVVILPPRGAFHDAPSHYHTAYHELAHSTGHATRLNRATLTDTLSMSSENYGREELTAELAAALLSAHAGILPAQPDNTVAYLQNWRQAISADRTMILAAAAAAQHAADYILAVPVAAQVAA